MKFVSIILKWFHIAKENIESVLMNPKLVVDMFMSNEIKVIQDTEKMRMSIVEFEGNYCVLKKYIGRNLKNVYQNIID